MIDVSIIGATGYTGGELIRILLRHPEVRIRHITSESSAGKKLEDVHGDLRGRADLTFEKFDAATLAKDSDLGFFALPHGAASGAVSQFAKAGKKAIDLSADFRLQDVKLYEKWYKVNHADPVLLKDAVYGLPELYRDKIRRASVVANPGCYATTTILALTPLLREKLVDLKTLVVDAKSGVSGAGKKLADMYHYPEATENFQAYAVAQHRHMPEIEQILSHQAGEDVKLTFVPHLVPMKRGILANAYAALNSGMTQDKVLGAFEKAYGRERFIRLLPSGLWPQTKDVAQNNYCDISLKVDDRTNRVIVLAALDNLVKGAAGQAVQNMNLMFQFPEEQGLL